MIHTEAINCPYCGETGTINLEDNKLPDVSWLKCNWCGERPVIAEWKQCNPKEFGIGDAVGRDEHELSEDSKTQSFEQRRAR